MAEPIERIVILGGGTAGWMTAAALSRVLHDTPVVVTLIESETIGSVGVGEATIPPILGFNRFVGLDERLLLRDAQATFKLGIAFDGWLRAGEQYFHPFGEFGVEIDSIPFQHWWRRADQRFADLWAFSLETQAARAGRFAHRTGIEHPLLAETAYAYHFDASHYAILLRDLAQKRGVERVQGEVSHVELDGETGYIVALRLVDGRVIEGDLFIDCSGFRSLLLGETLGVEFNDWSDALPCDSAWAVQSAGSDGAPYTRATARPAGWQWRIPLQQRTGNGYVFSSAHTEPQAALRLLEAHLPNEAITEPRLLRFRAGHRAVFWKGNCVGIGLSTGFLEPLESTSIHLIQLAVLRLIGLLPDRGFDPSLAKAYNRELSEKIELIRDFLVLHYRASERNEPFWLDCRSATAPDRLKNRIDLYRASGVVPAEDADLFKPSSWLAVMEGQGIASGRAHPLVRHKTVEDAAKRVAAVSHEIAGAVRRMPAASEYIAAAVGSLDRQERARH